MKNLSILILLLNVISGTFIFAQNNLPYLGQDPPGMTAKRFPPDSLLANSNWWWHGSPVFTSDGLEMFWTEYVMYTPTYHQATLFDMKVENNNWGTIHYPPFGNQNYFENNPVLSTGGDTVYFFSTNQGGPFFMTTNSLNGWSQPLPVPIPIPSGSGNGLQFAVNRNGDFYIEVSMPPSAPSDIYISRITNGNHQIAEKLGPEINSDYIEAFPFVDPDEEYLIFASNRPGGYGGQFDMYISFKKNDGTWTDAVNMGSEINATGAWFASVTLDKQYLFFNSWRSNDEGYNPYWISADIIDSLHNIVGMKEPVKSSADIILHQNKPNPFHESTLLSFRLAGQSSVTLTVVDIFGKNVATLINNENMDAGKHTVCFSSEKFNLPSGIYHYSLVTKNKTITRKMIYAK
jgi:hypothetical protein